MVNGVNGKRTVRGGHETGDTLPAGSAQGGQVIKTTGLAAAQLCTVCMRNIPYSYCERFNSISYSVGVNGTVRALHKK